MTVQQLLKRITDCSPETYKAIEDLPVKVIARIVKANRTIVCNVLDAGLNYTQTGNGPDQLNEFVIFIDIQDHYNWIEHGQKHKEIPG